ncbi:MAG: hypothetical protein ACOYJS_06895, partial [Acutalibacteraceae bacterium]
NCGNERPLVKHNIIKRIGDYKMSQILSNKISVAFSAEGIPTDISGADYSGETLGNLTEGEINGVMRLLSDYYNVTAERVNLDSLNATVLKNAYISGTGLLYTYWNPSINTGLFADEQKSLRIKGDICCEILGIEDVVFGDPYCDNLQQQPYIIISSRQNVEDVIREARLFGADLATLTSIYESARDGKITVLTRFHKEYGYDGSYKINCVKVVENAFVRREFCTNLRLYPISIFRWENKNGCAYGESEITYLIPNQIAINRMITANVWSAMTTGMPIMIVNGDTVNEKITNDPGQIIKVYGSNEDVAGAIKYVSPAASIKEFDDCINNLISNTLTQSGANEVALGDSKADNATALITMRDAALMPLQIVKNRYYSFVEETARIWADFWITHYGRRKLKCESNGVCRYVMFDADRYRELIISARVDVNKAPVYSDSDRLDTLITLFEKGIINKRELLKRLPKGIIPDIGELLAEGNEVSDNDGI